MRTNTSVLKISKEYLNINFQIVKENKWQNNNVLTMKYLTPFVLFIQKENKWYL